MLLWIKCTRLKSLCRAGLPTSQARTSSHAVQDCSDLESVAVQGPRFRPLKQCIMDTCVDDESENRHEVPDPDMPQNLFLLALQATSNCLSTVQTMGPYDGPLI